MKEKIAVNVKTQAEYDILMDAYNKKGWTGLIMDSTNEQNIWYRYKEETCIGFDNQYSCYSIGLYKYYGYKIISLREALQRLDGLTTDERKAYIDIDTIWYEDTFPNLDAISKTFPDGLTAGEYLDKLNKQRTVYEKSLENHFNPLQKKPMSKLRENIRNSFFNTQEKHLTNLVSNLEEKTEGITDVLEVLYDKCEETQKIIELLENAIDNNDKSEVNRLKKRLEAIAVDFDDKLWEQLIVIAKKLNK